MSDDPESDASPVIPIEAFKSLGNALGAHLAEHHPNIDFALILVDGAASEKSKSSMVASAPLHHELRTCADRMESTYAASLSGGAPGDLN